MFAEHAWRAVGGRAVPDGPLEQLGVPYAGTLAAALPYAELGCATALLLGLLTPLAGTALACAAAVALWASPEGAAGMLVDASGASPALLVVLAAACLVPAVRPGRLTLDRLVFARRAGDRRAGAAERESREPGVVPRRPEHAPPLLYPEGRAAIRRPSRT